MSDEKKATSVVGVEPGSPQPTEPIPKSELDAPKPAGKPGRKKGSKNKVKTPPKLTERRAPRAVVDLEQRITRTHEALNKDYEEYNRRHGTHIVPLPEKMGDVHKPKIDMPKGAVGNAIGVTAAILGGMWDVEARPSKADLDAADKAWQPVLAIFAVDPTYIAIGGAVGATAGCFMPLFMERQMVKKGKLLPASKRPKDGSGVPPLAPVRDLDPDLIPEEHAEPQTTEESANEFNPIIVQKHLADDA